MTKAIIVKVYHKGYYDYEERLPDPVVEDWIELSDEELSKLNLAISEANQLNRARGKDFNYVLITKAKPEDIFKDAKAWAEQQKKERDRRVAEEARRVAANKAKAETRKRNQLEKLKKEFGEA